MLDRDRYHGLSRREFVASGGSLAAILSIPPGLIRFSKWPPLERPHLATALKAADWLYANRLGTANGVVWPADPEQPDSVVSNLYSGTPGVVLFYVELFQSTDDRRFLAEAKAGADHLVALVDSGAEPDNGLYVGLAGVGYTLDRVYRASGDERYGAAARSAFDRTMARAERVGTGVAWLQNGADARAEVVDIVSGAAGTTLGLLYAHDQMDHDGALDTAVLAGRRLVELGQSAGGGRKWAMDESFPRLMPNFSHGTAGVAYTLARLHAVTGDDAFLAGALDGARYLQSVMTRDADGGWRIFHHEPEGEDLFYLSWCHGPVGTARLFYQLAEATGDSSWVDLVHRGARGIVNTGVPERRTPGFWENVSQCCGTCGVGEFFMSLCRMTGRADYREFVTRLTDDLHRRAIEDAAGMRWVQAEHRVRPELLQAQTGLMQGAAGVGLYFLHLDAMERGGDVGVVLPDSPFGSHWLHPRRS